MEEIENIRWDKLDPVYKGIIDSIYTNELTGLEIDTLVGLINVKIGRDKMVSIVYNDVKNMLMMDAVASALSPQKETDKSKKDYIYK